MKTFTVIWFGQLVSMLGSGLTSFALGVWVYQGTGSVTLFALIALFAMLPGIVLAPLAGALVDRWDRRRVMLLSDLGAGLSTLAIVLLLLTGRLEVWHIFLMTAISSTFNTFQWPAYAASIPLLAPKEQLSRANGMVQLAQAVSQLLAPVLAGVLMATVGLEGVIMVDVITFLVAVATLWLCAIPRPERATAVTMGPGALLGDIVGGWTFLIARRGLLALLILFGASNFLIGAVSVLATPLVLAFSSTATLGIVLSIGGSGMLFGSLLMSAWGGPTRRVYGMYACMLLEGLAILVGGLQPSVLLVTIAAFAFFFALPIDATCCQAILHSKVPLELQGRVFATQRMVARSCLPLAYLVAGPLADGVFEPLLVSGGPLASSLGHIVGVGTGRGIGLLFVVFGLLYLLLVAGSFLYPRLRRVELELPDVIVATVTSHGSDDAGDRSPARQFIERPAAAGTDGGGQR